MSAPSRKLTDEQRADLVAAIQAGVATYQAIGDRFGISKTWVSETARGLGIVRRRGRTGAVVTQEEPKPRRTAKAAGPQVPGGVDVGVAMRDGPVITPDVERRIVAAIRAGCTGTQLAERFGGRENSFTEYFAQARALDAASRANLDEDVKKRHVDAAAQTTHAWESPAPENVRAAALALLATFDKAAGPDRARDQALAARALRKLLEANPDAGAEPIAADADLQRDYDEARAHNRELNGRVEQLEADLARTRGNLRAIQQQRDGAERTTRNLVSAGAALEEQIVGALKELDLAGSLPLAVRAWRERGTEMQIAAVAAARRALDRPPAGEDAADAEVEASPPDDARTWRLTALNLAFEVTRLERALTKGQRR